ncbi:MAG: bifunctional folylpolyglutamate synthase/dihydrofolate synthase [Muribaculaceae bacterium]|jgi:dihydrofolate synthase / folylpolyglutamate synthase|nr:bifunctional folylpolyglutamate synthase/dihydrofolate synthase [Muribaculaceae bacterium]
MNYKESLNYLYGQLPMFQRIGGAAYKAGLETSELLDGIYGHPHRAFPCIHVAGTNGKGSVSHLIASILQLNGYKVGLYTSPHLVDFRERIRVDGKMITEDYVTSFVNGFLSRGFSGKPSFFELTMMMAFDYFRFCKVDVAVIEVGLGGRLDSTNIISPVLSIVTNISLDHTQFLGNTLPQIASEKAGIIKHGIPSLIGEAQGDVRKVFENKAAEVGSPIKFAEDSPQIANSSIHDDLLYLDTKDFGQIIDELSGDCQLKNSNTVLNAIPLIREAGFKVSDQSIIDAFRRVCEISGLRGRWMVVGASPRVVCDTGHNVGGISYIARQLARQKYTHLRIVIGFVNDKDINHILDLLPTDATYYFAQASVARALDSRKLKELANSKNLHGDCFADVKSAFIKAHNDCSPSDMIYVGGSTFIVADFLASTDCGQQ